MELGNLIFGNSRGNYPIDRDLVNSEEWIRLVHKLLQVEDYHCCINDYYQDYSTEDLEYKKRTNKLTPNEYGGFSLILNNEIIFEIFPYWWGECTCGVEDENEKLYQRWKDELFTKKEWKDYMTFEDWCKNDCPACSLLEDNKNKKDEDLLSICTCGTINKNIKIKKRKTKIKEKIKEYERREQEEYIPHKNNCCLVKPNFVYRPTQDDCFSIEWYKYPFRDSYSNKKLSNVQIRTIFNECADLLEKYILEIGGTY